MSARHLDLMAYLVGSCMILLFLHQPIIAIFTASIREGHVPNVWKMANVLLLAKVHAPMSVDSDLRPVSMAPTIRIVCDCWRLDFGGGCWQTGSKAVRRTERMSNYSCACQHSVPLALVNSRKGIQSSKSCSKFYDSHGGSMANGSRSLA